MVSLLVRGEYIVTEVHCIGGATEDGAQTLGRRRDAVVHFERGGRKRPVVSTAVLRASGFLGQLGVQKPPAR